MTRYYGLATGYLYRWHLSSVHGGVSHFPSLIREATWLGAPALGAPNPTLVLGLTPTDITYLAHP